MDSYYATCSHELRESYELCFQSIADNVYKILKCFKCNEYCHPPFRQNTEGKLICPFCFQRCGGAIKALKQRIFVLEMMYSVFEFPCKYNFDGCSFKGKGATVVEHQKVCDYVSTICHYNDCYWRGQSKQLFDHCLSHHSNLVELHDLNTKEIPFTAASESTVYEFNTVLAYEKVFAVHLVKNHQKGIFCYIATNLEPLDTKNFEFGMEFQLGEGRKAKLILSLTQSYNIMVEEMYELPHHELPIVLIDRKYSIMIEKKL